jgi:hypothetical protein
LGLPSLLRPVHGSGGNIQSGSHLFPFLQQTYLVENY